MSHFRGRTSGQTLGLQKSRKVFVAAAIPAFLGASLMGSVSAYAQCAANGSIAQTVGFNLAPLAAGGSVNSLVAAINTVNTAFLTQSSAFISAPNNPEPNSTGGGVWARGVGGEVNTRSSGVTNVTLNGAPVAGNITCQTRTQMSFTGVQIGTDTSLLNWNGWNVHGGSTIGYIGADIQDKSIGGSFADNLQVPFGGVYGVVTKGGFFADGQIRMDAYQNKVTDISNGLFGQHFDARGIAVNANVGYNYALPQNWFIEPSLGFVWSRVSVEPLNTSGTFVLANNPTGISPPGTVYVAPLYSSIGRASLRTGTTIAYDQYTLTPFVTASIFRQFEGSVTTRYQSSFDNLGAAGAGLPSIGATVRTSNLGTWGQIGVGVAARLNNSGWLGYIRSDFRFGAHYDGWSLVGGLRYQFTPEELFAARVTKGPAAPRIAPAPYNWAGFRIGALVGTASGNTSWNAPAFGTQAFPRFAGILGGGQVGYDYQFSGKWVAGVIADFTGTNAHGARTCPNGFFFTCEASADWLASGMIRVGYAYWDRILIYGKGGVAAGRIGIQTTCNTGSNPTLFIALSGCPAQSAARSSVGWTVGFGSEFALTKNWSVTADTKYFNLGKESYTVDGTLINVKRDGWISTIGLNYRFDLAQAPPVPVIAKY